MRKAGRFIVNIMYLLGAWFLIGLSIGSIGISIIFLTLSDTKNAIIFGGAGAFALIIILPLYIPYFESRQRKSYKRSELEIKRKNDIGNVSYTGKKVKDKKIDLVTKEKLKKGKNLKF